jgi:6-pyruvoyltetrahydropterin/6-carboxytetrahydropterin synthase
VPKVKITREVHFNAAHRVYNPDWDDEKNAEVFGGCANPNWHGHNYELFVTIEGEPNPVTGFVMDLRDLRDLVTSRVLDDVDHRNINVEVPWMDGIMPSTENLVVCIWNRLVGEFPEGVRLCKLTLWETKRHYVEYEGD